MGRRTWVILVGALCLAGCSKSVRDGVLSQELPLTVDDLTEIRSGELNHEKVLWHYRLYENAKLQEYAQGIVKNLAAVSERPNLPYRVFLLDDDEVNVFGGPGGYLYMTRGVFNFVTSESELAGMLSHEIMHVAGFDYSSIPHLSRVQKVYDVLMKGSELAKDSIGSYGTAANYGLKAVGKASPYVAKRFGIDSEITSDEKSTDCLMKAGYDPRGLLAVQERLSKVAMQDVARFVIYLNAHPPFEARRRTLDEKVRELHLEAGKVEFRQDLLSEIRREDAGEGRSILFQPDFGARYAPLNLSAVSETTKTQDKLAS